MGKLKKLDILFANNKDVYNPGEQIYGEVNIVVSETKGDIRGIQVECVGKSHCHWTESHGSGDNRRTETYDWTVHLFHHSINLRGEANSSGSNQRIVLPAGDHRFPFTFQIPHEELPPPLEGTWGHVRYTVKVTIDRPWRFDHHATRYFSVMTIKDLRAIPYGLSPQSKSDEKTVCCCCCASGPIIMKATIDKSAYVPGERICVSVSLINNSSREIIDVKASVQQKVTFRAKHCGSTHQRTSSKTAAMVKLDGCEPMGSLNHENRPLLIPPIPPNCFDRCPNIDVNYFVVIEADISLTPLDVKIAFPVTIGTIPITAHPHRPPIGLPQAQPPPQNQGHHVTQGHPSHGYPPNPGQPTNGYPQAPGQGYPTPTAYPQPQSLGYPPPQGQPQQGYPPHGQTQPGYPQPHQGGVQGGYPPPPGHPQGQHVPGPSGGVFPPSSKIHPMNTPQEHPSQPPPVGGTQQGFQTAPSLPVTGNEYQPKIEESGPSDDLPPPPTYEMAIGGPQQMPTDEGNFGTIMYAPRYPFYNFGNSLNELQTVQVPEQPITTQPQSSM